MFKQLFSLEKDGSSHFTLILLGIKFHILRPELRARRKDYKVQYSNPQNISDIPCATGNLRMIQLANLELLRQFNSICKENNINYWLDFGTLLGAKRHHGFIPWDDDIDVGMAREDYEKFIELFSGGFKSHPDLYCFFSCNGRNKCFIKVRHKKTDNLFIDIFPYDYAPKMTPEEKVLFSQKISKLLKKNIFRYFKTPEATRKYLKERTLKKLTDGKSRGSLFWGIDFPHKWVNKVYDYEQIFPLSEIEFEGKKFPAPNNVHEVLTSIYGDYMSIPKDVYPRHSNYNLMGEELDLIQKYAKGDLK